MKDKNNRELQLSLDTKLLQRLRLIRNAQLYKIVLVIFENILIREDELCSKVFLDANKIKKLISKGECFDLIDVYKDNKYNVYYSVSYILLKSKFICSGCEFSRDNKYGKECKSSVHCVGNYYRCALALLNKCKKTIGFTNCEVEYFEGLAVKLNDEFKRKTVQIWILDDFVNFYRDKFIESYPHIKYPKKAIIRRYLVQLKKIFVEEYQLKWQFLLKRYLIVSYKIAIDKGEVMSLRYISEWSRIKPFIKNKKHTSITLCKTYGIYCPYWDRKCTLPELGNECNKKLRTEMRVSYN